MAPAACSWSCLTLLTSVLSFCCFLSLSLALETCCCPSAWFRLPYLFCFRLARLLLLLAFFFCLLPSLWVLWLLQFALIISCPWLIVMSSLTCFRLLYKKNILWYSIFSLINNIISHVISIIFAFPMSQTIYHHPTTHGPSPPGGPWAFSWKLSVPPRAQWTCATFGRVASPATGAKVGMVGGSSHYATTTI